MLMHLIKEVVFFLPVLQALLQLTLVAPVLKARCIRSHYFFPEIVIHSFCKYAVKSVLTLSVAEMEEVCFC